jgi:hypothetical protein
MATDQIVGLYVSTMVNLRMKHALRVTCFGFEFSIAADVPRARLGAGFRHHAKKYKSFIDGEKSDASSHEARLRRAGESVNLASSRCQ